MLRKEIWRLIIVHKADPTKVFSGLKMNSKNKQGHSQNRKDSEFHGITRQNSNDIQSSESINDTIHSTKPFGIDTKTTKTLEITEKCEKVLILMQQNCSVPSINNEYLPRSVKDRNFGITNHVCVKFLYL